MTEAYEHLRPFFGDGHHNLRRPEDLQDLDPMFERASQYLDFYPLAFYTADSEAFKRAAHISEGHERTGLVIEDWKWQQDAPTMAYLGRNLQFALYYLCAAEGEFMTSPDHWIEFRQFPRLAWVDLARFKAYTRKTAKDKSDPSKGYYEKGDERDMKTLVRTWTYSPDKEDAMKEELALRVRMAHANMWPTSPDKLGCHLCESWRWCPAFHKDDE